MTALIDELRAELALGEQKIASYQSELQEELDLLSKDYDTIKAECDSLIEESKALKAANEELKASNITLKKEVGQIEQYSRMNNVEIRGVLNAEDENLPQLIADMGSEVKFPITSSDIDVVRRVPTYNNQTANNILVRFVSRNKRKKFQNKAKKAHLTSKDLGNPPRWRSGYDVVLLCPKDVGWIHGSGGCFSDAAGEKQKRACVRDFGAR